MIAALVQLLHLLDIAALWVVWWCAAAALASAPEVRSWRELVIWAGLLGAMVFSFTGAIALSLEPAGGPPWWATGFRISLAVVAGVFYEARFGVVRHLAMLWHWIVSLPARWRRFGRPA